MAGKPQAGQWCAGHEHGRADPAASRLAALQTDAADLRHALHDAAATRDAALAQSDLLQGQIPYRIYLPPTASEA